MGIRVIDRSIFSKKLLLKSMVNALIFLKIMCKFKYKIYARGINTVSPYRIPLLEEGKEGIYLFRVF